jgi:hypothetical protein
LRWPILVTPSGDILLHMRGVACSIGATAALTSASTVYAVCREKPNAVNAAARPRNCEEGMSTPVAPSSVQAMD